MSIAARALWLLENRLAEPPDLQTLAAALAVSPYGLLRAFAARFETTPMAYLRRRRLSEAARALAQGAPSILEVALGAGYASHAAFSRAFKEQFGRTPDEARIAPIPEERLTAAALTSPTAPAPACAPPRIEAGSHGPLVEPLLGLREPVAANAAGGIPALWGAFAAQTAPYLRPGAPPHVSYGVLETPNCADDETAPTTTYMCAFPAAAFASTPPGTTRLVLPARRYVVVESAAHVSEIRAVWRAVWDDPAIHALGALADGPDLERYGATFDPRTGAGGFSVMIPLRDAV